MNSIVLLVISLSHSPSDNIKIEKFGLNSTKKLNKMLIIMFHLPCHTTKNVRVYKL